MKISFKLNIILFFFIISGCVSYHSIKKNHKFSENSNYGKYLAAKRSIYDGNAAYASYILNDKINFKKQNKLIELAFFVKIINGDFHEAENLKVKFSNILDKNSFYNIPTLTISLLNNKLLQAEKLIQLSDDLPGFKELLNKTDTPADQPKTSCLSILGLGKIGGFSNTIT